MKVKYEKGNNNNAISDNNNFVIAIFDDNKFIIIRRYKKRTYNLGSFFIYLNLTYRYRSSMQSQLTFLLGELR